MSLKKGGRKERKRRKTGNPSRERKNVAWLTLSDSEMMEYQTP